MFQLDLQTQHYYSASFGDFASARLVFSTANSAASILGADSTPFFGTAFCYVNASYSFDNTYLAIQQFSTTSYGIFAYMLEYGGKGFFRTTLNQSGDTFTYSGIAQNPAGCYINPALTTWVTPATIGLGSVNNTSDSQKPVSVAQQAALDLKSNISNPIFTGVVNAPIFTGSTGSFTNLRSTNLVTASEIITGPLTVLFNTYEPGDE